MARLEAYSPDLIFNTAEGRRGRFREAFYPGALRGAGLRLHGLRRVRAGAHPGQAAHQAGALASTASARPGWQFVEKLGELKAEELRFPVIVKPNFEGSSKGITQDSVAETLEQAREKVAQALARYPAGVLVEEFISGQRLHGAVPGRGATTTTTACSRPVEYVIDAAAIAGRKYAIYDYELKTKIDEGRARCAPRRTSRRSSPRTLRADGAGRSSSMLDCRDLGRIDFRLSATRACRTSWRSTRCPRSSRARASTPRRSSRAALGRGDQRHHPERGASATRSRTRAAPGQARAQVGPAAGGLHLQREAHQAHRGRRAWRTREAEYDSPTTLQAIREAIASWGHEVVDLEATAELPSVLRQHPVGHRLQHRRGLQGPQPREPGARDARAARHPLHGLGSGHARPSRSTRRWRRRSSARRASTRPTSS